MCIFKTNSFNTQCDLADSNKREIHIDCSYIGLRAVAVVVAVVVALLASWVAAARVDGVNAALAVQYVVVVSLSSSSLGKIHHDVVAPGGDGLAVGPDDEETVA